MVIEFLRQYKNMWYNMLNNVVSGLYLKRVCSVSKLHVNAELKSLP